MVLLQRASFNNFIDIIYIRACMHCHQGGSKLYIVQMVQPNVLRNCMLQKKNQLSIVLYICIIYYAYILQNNSYIILLLA